MSQITCSLVNPEDRNEELVNKVVEFLDRDPFKGEEPKDFLCDKVRNWSALVLATTEDHRSKPNQGSKIVAVLLLLIVDEKIKREDFDYDLGYQAVKEPLHLKMKKIVGLEENSVGEGA